MYFLPYRDQVSFLGKQWIYKTSTKKELMLVFLMPKYNFVATVWLCESEILNLHISTRNWNYIWSIESDCRSRGCELDHDLVPYFFGIRSWDKLAITRSDCFFFHLFLVCRQRCNRYWNISSGISVHRPGSEPLGGLKGWTLAKIQLLRIW